MSAWLERLDPWLLIGCVAALAFVVGRVVGVRAGRRPDREPPPPAAAGNGGPTGVREVATASVPAVRPRVGEDLVVGLIGAHDLAAEMRATAVQAHIEQVLGGVGVRRIRVDIAGPFDENLHQAISVERGTGVTAPVIGREVRPGWADGDAVVRPAEVVVRTP